MPINPIDILRTQEAAQFKHIESQRAQHAQDQINHNFQSVIEHEHDRPKEATKSDNSEYRYDAKQKGNNQYHGSKENKKEKKEENKESKKPTRRGGFDILI